MRSAAARTCARGARRQRSFAAVVAAAVVVYAYTLLHPVAVQREHHDGAADSIVAVADVPAMFVDASLPHQPQRLAQGVYWVPSSSRASVPNNAGRAQRRASALGNGGGGGQDTPQLVFNIGAHKTGTTSVEEALRQLGFHVAFGWDRIGPPATRTSHAAASAAAEAHPVDLEVPLQDAVDNYYFGGGAGRLNATARRAFSDAPFNLGDAFKQLRARHPDALFILGVRDPSKWAASYCSFLRRFFNVTEFASLPLWVRSLIVTAYNGGSHAQTLRGWHTGCTSWAPAMVERNLEVVRYFMCGDSPACVAGNASYAPALYRKPSQQGTRAQPWDTLSGLGGLLVYNVADLSWQPLCTLLGVQAPRAPFPHANAVADLPQYT